MMSPLWAILLVSCSLAVGAEAKKGFLLTAPKILDENSEEALHLNLYDIKASGTVRVTLLNPETLEEFASSASQVNSGVPEPLSLKIPETGLPRALINVVGEFEDESYSINATKDIFIRDRAITTFIQTDKGIYKPGQKVMLRVLPVDQMLKPLGQKAQGNIWIEDPAGVRVAQWLNETFHDGLIQKTMQLSKEPTLGSWSVHALINDKPAIQVFDVNEYVLPKFEVNIIPPPYVLTNATEIKWKVCAKYTYGQMVEGSVTLKASFQSYKWESTKPPFIEATSEIHGCFEYTLDIESLKNRINSTRETTPSFYYYRPIVLNAEVTEKGTGVKMNSSREVSRTSSPLTLTFLDYQRGGTNYKPGIPYFGKVLVKTPDGMPAPNRIIEFCLESRHDFHQPGSENSENTHQHCRNFTSDSEGQIIFGVPPRSREEDNLSIYLKAVDYPSHDYRIPSPSHLYPATGSLYLKAYYSPSNSYLQIEPISDVQCGTTYPVKIKLTGEEGDTYNLHYQVIARGHIAHQGSLPYTLHKAEIPPEATDQYIVPANDTTGRLCRNNTCQIDDIIQQPLEVGEAVLPLEISPQFSPSAHLLVYYIRTDGETVADSVSIKPHPCLSNQVNLQFKAAEQYPGTTATLDIEAAPSSLCGIGAVDKSVHLLSAGNHLTKEKVNQLLLAYDIPRYSQPRQESYSHCMMAEPDLFPVPRVVNRPPIPPTTVPKTEVPEKTKRSIIPHYRHFSSNYIDSISAFEDVGALVISDMTLETRPCRIFSPYPEYYHPAAPVAFSNRGTGPGLAGVPAMRGPTAVPKPPPPPGRPNSVKPVVAVRTDFRETWLWDLQPVGESGKASIERELPHTITEWVANGVCINSDAGLGVSDPATIKAFQPFFVSSTLPYSVIRGESTPVIITIFNYLQQCLPIKISLEKSENFTLLNDSSSLDACVCGGKSITERFMIKPQTLGKTKVTVYVKSTDSESVCGNEIVKVNARDAATWDLLVEAEGFPKEDIFSSFFCPKDFPDSQFSTEFNLQLPEYLVADSARSTLSISGDLMGPPLKGLDRLVKLPTGCGEQNMVLFTPNIVVMEYLTDTDKLTPDIKKKALNNMKTGYQRELTYRHPDGSYSAFGARDPEGSLWLTAFVVRSFAQARRFIPIDERDLSTSINWIVSKQNENGCFPIVGKVLHSGMKGGLSGHDSLAPLTAYTLISLLESDYRNETVLEKAFSCLEAESDPPAYSLALFTYAALTANHPSAEKYSEKLFEKADHQGDLQFWKEGKSGDSRSINVEIASYAVLSLTKQGGQENLAKALPIVRWITKQRNSNGGFVSTQDTVVALQALAKYASSFDAGVLDLSVKAEADNLEHTFDLTENNKLLVQTVNVPSLPTQLAIKSSGSGCGYVQAVLKYNLLKTERSQAFRLKVTAEQGSTDDCKIATIQTCTTFILNGEKSNMVVVEVKMISGYAPDKSSLRQLLADETLGLKRFEAGASKIAFYFDELDSSEKCFSFQAVQDVVVENLQPAIARVFDYYEQEKSVSISYEIDNTCDQS